MKLIRLQLDESRNGEVSLYRWMIRCLKIRVTYEAHTDSQPVLHATLSVETFISQLISEMMENWARYGSIKAKRLRKQLFIHEHGGINLTQEKKPSFLKL